MTNIQQTNSQQKQQTLPKQNDMNNTPITKDNKKRCPLEYTNPIFKLSYEWLTPLIFRGARHTLEMDDLYDIRLK
jgi:hypothetical protein